MGYRQNYTTLFDNSQLFFDITWFYFPWIAIAILLDFFEKIFNLAPDLVPCPSELFHDYRLRSHGPHRVPDRPMNMPDIKRCAGAGFCGMVAERDDDVHGFEKFLVDLRGLLSGNIDTQLPHCGNRPRMNSRRNEPCAAWLDHSFPACSRKSFGHL